MLAVQTVSFQGMCFENVGKELQSLLYKERGCWSEAENFKSPTSAETSKVDHEYEN